MAGGVNSCRSLCSGDSVYCRSGGGHSGDDSDCRGCNVFLSLVGAVATGLVSGSWSPLLRYFIKRRCSVMVLQSYSVS